MVSNSTPQWEMSLNEARLPTGKESCGETASVAFESEDEQPPVSRHTMRLRDKVVRRRLTGPKLAGVAGLDLRFPQTHAHAAVRCTLMPKSGRGVCRCQTISCRMASTPFVGRVGGGPRSAASTKEPNMTEYLIAANEERVPDYSEERMQEMSQGV